MVISALHRFLFNSDYDKSLLMKSNYIVWGIIIFYISFVKFFGPELMKNRKPMKLQYTLVLFNAFLVICNGYLCFKLTQLCFKFWSIRCKSKYNPNFLKDLGYIGHQVLLLKIVELADTVLFILKKKYNQASFLHVSHHSLVVLIYWAALRRNETGYFCCILGSINAGVHVLTYMYYGMSAMGPSMRKYLWWKKYLSMIQMAQFFVLIPYLGYNFISGCEEFGFHEKCGFAFLVFLLGLLFNFYFKTYSRKEQKSCM